MNPYHYSVVQIRDPKFPGERRNVGLLVVCPALGKAWLRSGGLRQRAHLLGDDADFVRVLLALLEEEAKEVAKERSAKVVHGWMRARALPSEDALQLTRPAMGVASDMQAEVARLREAYMGKPPSPGRSAAEKVRDVVLRSYGLRDRFHTMEFESGPAVWRFGTVANLSGRPLVLNALEFTQRSPEGLLDAAFKNVGRAHEVAAYHAGVQWLTLAKGPASGPACAAFERACVVMNDAGLQVVSPKPDDLVAALTRVGLLPNGATAAEA